MTDISDRKETDLHIQLLVQKLTHRSKNLLTVIQAIARQSVSTTGTVQDFLDRFAHRLHGLSASQDVLVRGNWKEVQMSALIREHLSYFVDLDDLRADISGPDISVNVHVAQAIGMAIHELATNAMKYGSLSVETGKVQVFWQLNNKPGNNPRYKYTG